jgi:predicted P-loop ATPase
LSGDYNPDAEGIQELVDTISDFNSLDLISKAPLIFETVRDPTQREIAKAVFLSRADEVGCDKKIIEGIFKTAEKQEQEEKRKLNLRILNETSLTLDRNRHGVPLPTINNFFTVMMNDRKYDDIQFNLLSNQPEIVRQTLGEETLLTWTDTDEAESMNYIEKEYGFYSAQKHAAALRMLFRQREYHPIRNLIDGLKWDGQNRVEHCLTRWLKVEDSPYTREVSRLIFAGGINRLYNPGCKFDDVPVIVGTSQGEGKTSFIQWLAINEQWFSEVKKVDGQDAIEALQGAWICEIPELSAFKKADDVESIKAFVTRMKDKYRKPYDKNPQEYPRQCIFIGTTNNEQFLTDKTGNRRFYPVLARSFGYDLFDHEQECREYILQCWAEARERFTAGNMPAFANRDLLDEYRKHQDAAMEDDWRVGKIESYLARFNVGEKVCALQIWRECLYPDSTQMPKMSESRAVGQIMAKMEGWEKCPNLQRTQNYGHQRCWQKAKESRYWSMEGDDLPL